MLYFKTIRWKNFLSYGNYWSEIHINKNRLTLLTAKNGSGKSSVLDSVTFCLFGRPYRKINKPNLVNSINAKGLVTEIEFDVTETGDSYKIIRGMKPSIFEIIKNGKKLDETDSTRDQQKYLEESVLKCNYRAFTQLIVLSTGGYIPFMHLTPSQRREFIENILDINIFSMMNQVLKEKNSILKDLTGTNHAKTETLKSNIIIQEKLVSSIHQQKEDSLRLIDEELSKIDADIVHHMEDRERYSNDIQQFQNELLKYSEEKLRKLERQGNSVISDAKVTIQRIDKDLKFMTEHISCPTCKQDISEEHKNYYVHDKDLLRREKETLLQQAQQKYTEVSETLTKVDKFKRNIDELSYKISIVDGQIEKLKAIRDQSSTKRENILHELPSTNDEYQKLEQMKVKLEEYEERRTFLLNKMDLYQVAFELLKDSGIKSQIISQYIPIINKLVSSYLNDLDFPVAFTLDKDFNESILSRYRDSFTYDSFSAGERNRIDLALLFTWRSIAEIKNSIHTNLLIFDEIFDGSLDSDGIDNFLKILETASKDANIFIISHKIDSTSDIFDRALKIEKSNDFSYLEEVNG